MIKSVICIALIAVAGAANAAGNTVPAAKQELVQRILQLWPLEGIGETMLRGPVSQAVSQADVVLQGRVSPEKRDAAVHDIAEDVKKFLDENRPLVRAKAQKLVMPTVGPILAEKFSEEELRQIIALLESPVKKKFESVVPELQKALGEKVAADTRETIEPRLEDLRQRIGTRLRTVVTP
ncbi:DUF2059 domain-containing protein [Herbaspirillum sp. HC18]|nr:DUF2059 domain-containing protein [Herbaspirillum sp. HC18]